MKSHFLRGPAAFLAALALAALPMTGAIAQPGNPVDSPAPVASSSEGPGTPTVIPSAEPSDTAAPSITELPAELASETPAPSGTAMPVPTDTSAPEPTDTATPEPTDTSTPEPTDTSTPEPTDGETAVEPTIDLGSVTAMQPGPIAISLAGLTPNGDYTLELIDNSGADLVDRQNFTSGTVDADGNTTLEFLVSPNVLDGSYHFRVTDETTGTAANSSNVDISHVGQITLDKDSYNWGDFFRADLTGLEPSTSYDVEIRHPGTGKGLLMEDVATATNGETAVTLVIERADFEASPGEPRDVSHAEFYMTVTGADGTVFAFTTASIQTAMIDEPVTAPSLTVPETERPGENLAVSLRDFAPNQYVTLSLVNADGSAVESLYEDPTVTADREGAAEGVIPIPWLIDQGAYKVLAVAADGGIVAESNTVQVEYEVQVTADKSDYNYGDPFTVTASGFAPGETVNLLLGIPYSDGVFWTQDGLSANAEGKVEYSGKILFTPADLYQVQDEKEYLDMVFVAETPDKSKFGLTPVSVQRAGPALPGSGTDVQGGTTLPETGASLNGSALGVGAALLLTGIGVYLFSRRTPQHG